MKKYKIISLLFIIIFLLSSCGKATENNKDTDKNEIIPSNFIYTPFSGSSKIDELNEFRKSQEAWVAFYETNPNIAVDIYYDKMGAGTIIHEIYGNKALFMKRYRALELAEYCYLLTGNFEFNFNT